MSGYTRIANVSDEVLAVCDREPIHIPESIQPHGAMIVVLVEQWRIVRVSRNVMEFLGKAPHALCGMALAELFRDREAWQHAKPLLEAILETPTEDRSLVPLRGPFQGLVCEGHAIRGKYLILEVEFPTPDCLSDGEEIELPRKTTASYTGGVGLTGVFHSITQAIRRFSGYDRVMIYKMDEDGHGTVIAESCRADLESYANWHFPASDIPRQARRLYLKNRVRMLSNVSYEPIPFAYKDVTDQSHPIDMSLSHLRSVSPVHVEYMQNMGVHATLVISIIVDGKLWGLIACHHYTPRHLDAYARNRCELFAHFITAVVAAEEQRNLREAIESSRTLHGKLTRLVGTGPDWKSRLMKCGFFIKDQLNATGFALFEAGQFFTSGIVPAADMLERVRCFMQSRLNDDLASCDDLKFKRDDFWSIGRDHAGCLMVEVARQPTLQLMWFRKEKRQTIAWGGQPQ